MVLEVRPRAELLAEAQSNMELLVGQHLLLVRDLPCQHLVAAVEAVITRMKAALVVAEAELRRQAQLVLPVIRPITVAILQCKAPPKEIH